MENAFSMTVQLRWSDFDANFHLRHSAYYDFGAMARVNALAMVGLSESFFKQNAIGPILFREECTFRKEVGLQDQLTISVALLQCRPNGSRFTISHELMKNGDLLAAEIKVLGDWLDLNTRKLALPAEAITEKVLRLPRHPDFAFI